MQDALRHGFDPWVGKIPRNRKWQPLQYSCLENAMDRRAWRATVHRVVKSDMTVCACARAHTHTHTRTHTHIYIYICFPGGTVAKNPTVNTGDAREVGLISRKILWSRKWQPTPVFLPGKLHGQRNLVGYSPWGCRVGHY